MSWRFLYINDCNSLSTKLDNLLINKGGEEYTIPLEDINTILLEDNKANITVKLLSRLTDYKISLIICDDKMMPTGIMMPFNKQHRTSKIAFNQIYLEEEYKNKIWAQIVKGKIRNQSEVLKIFYKDNDTSNKMDYYINQVEDGDISNREGHAAKIYFNKLFGMDFIRHEEDITNAALNYGYSIIRSNIARVVAMSGLIPNIGIHHKSELNNFNLVDDLIEPYRPVIDLIVAKNIEKKDFLERSDKMRLINCLNGSIEFNGKRCTLSNSIEKFVYEIIKVMKSKEKLRINIPKAESFIEDAI